MTEFEFHNLPVYQRVISYEYRGSPENFSQRIFDEVNDVLSTSANSNNTSYRKWVMWDVSSRQQGNLIATLFVKNMNYKRKCMITNLHDEIGCIKYDIYQLLEKRGEIRPETTIEEYEYECNQYIMYDEFDNLLYQKMFWMKKYQSCASK
jgi:hypothetical protein